MLYSAEKAHKRKRETVQTTNSSVVVERSRSFLLTVQLLQRVRGGRINEVKDLCRNLEVEEGRGLIFGRIRYVYYTYTLAYTRAVGKTGMVTVSLSLA